MANLQTTTANYARVAVGTTAERGSPAAGAMRYNTELNYTEIYNGTSWSRFTHSKNIKNHADVTTILGEHITYQSDIYKVHQFINAGVHTFTPRYTGTVEVLTIAGGGGGGRHSGAGGGAGGLLYNTSYAVTAGTAYTVVVGKGGTGAGNAGQKYATDTFDQFGIRGCASAFGPNMVTNGDFSSSTGWTPGTQWSITGGTAVKSGSDTSYLLGVPTTPFVQGQIYCATFDVSGAGTSVLLVNHNDASYTMPQVSNANADVSFSVAGGKAWGFWKQNSVNTNSINLYCTASVTIDNLAIFAVSSSLAAVGGGYGGTGGASTNGSTGGSGGGSVRNLGAGPAGTAGQGFAGGSSSFADPNYPAAGGGGAGGIGGSSTNTQAGAGGPGLAFSISGKSKWYAGGGGGNIQYNSKFGGSGGAGGGGDGAPAGAGSGTLTLLGTDGQFWTGSGGGGSHYDATFGGGFSRFTTATGADGIVIIRYPSVNPTQLVQVFTNTPEIGEANLHVWAAPAGVSKVEILVVGAGAGGGNGTSGGSGYAGGGGAGGLLYHQSYPIATGYNYTVKAGWGGAGGANGGNSYFSQIAGTTVLTSIGGGAGSSTHNAAGSAGGSGGGGGTSSAAGGAGTAGQGFAGGQGNLQASGDTGCGGGGGAGGTGSGSGANNNGANQGGAGLMYGISGEPVYYAAGGTGCGYYSGSYTGIAQMNAGSTNGSVGYHPALGTGPISTTVGKDAVNYTGSGGGGARVSGESGGRGGHGIVILRWYPTQT